MAIVGLMDMVNNNQQIFQEISIPALSHSPRQDLLSDLTSNLNHQNYDGRSKMAMIHGHITVLSALQRNLLTVLMPWRDKIRSNLRVIDQCWEIA